MYNETPNTDINRRRFLKAYISIAACITAIPKSSAHALMTCTDQPFPTLLAQSAWDTEPELPLLKIHRIVVPGANLWCTDTGGDGTPLVLLHAYTGSALNWSYQQEFFSAQGFRVIAYSRRGHYGSETTDKEYIPPSSSADLHQVVTALKLKKFHLLGTAAGGMIVPDYALSHPEKLLSITIACSLAGISEPAYVNDTKLLLDEHFHDLAPEHRELSSSYLLANKSGVKRWIELESISKNQEVGLTKMSNKITWGNLNKIKLPVLILTGDTDPYLPPYRAKKLADRFINGHYALITQAGHSAHWEQYEAFNKQVLNFLLSSK